MSDASFCTDAHRQAFGEEQLLAMQRLTDTSPVAQRTQRVAVPSFGAPAGADGGPTMAIIGERFAIGPNAIPGTRLTGMATPIAASALVLFRDREYTFWPDFPLAARSFQIPFHPMAYPSPKASVLGQTAALRLALPRATNGRKQHSLALRRFTLPLRVDPPEANPGTPGNAVASGSLLATDVSLSRVGRPYQRRARQLRPAAKPLRISLGIVGNIGGQLPSGNRDVDGLLGIFTAHVCYPLTPRLAITLTAALPETFVEEEFWESIESSSLAALLAATQYGTVQPAPPQPVAKPTTEALPTAGLPSWRNCAKPAATFASAVLRPVRGLQSIDKPTSTDIVRSPKRSSKVVATQPVRSIPVALMTFSAPRLAAKCGILQVEPPLPVTGRFAPNWERGWAVSDPIASLPARRVQLARAGLSSGATVPVKAPCFAGSASAADHGKLAWLPTTIRESRPTIGIRALGDGLAHASAVPCDLRPELQGGERPLYRPNTLQTVLRLRLPRHSPQLVRRYGTAECVAVAPPSGAVLVWRSPVADPLIPSPGAALPGPAPAARSLSLKRLPVRLYNVPRAQPMARPLNRKPLSFALGEWGGTPSMRPSGLVADDGKRRPSLRSTQRFGRELYERLSSGGLQELWRKATLLPSDLKWITMVVPLIIGIWVLARPSTAESVVPQPVAVQQETPDTAPEESGRRPQLAAVRPVVTQPIEDAAPAAAAKSRSESPATADGPTAWDNFTARIASRASINFNEDFRNGLSSWDGRGEWARSWSYDRAGTVRPGQMAIFQPSVGLKDYMFEMKASIERHSIQWMVRAANMQNYHFARLNVTPGAPLTRLELERWTVINGRVGKVTRLPLPHGGANQTLYSIRVDVHGDSITTYLQDQVIDTFSDSRLQDGGIGLVGGPDDRPRIYGIRVTHQNDFFGKLCSFLAPPPIHTQGSD